MAADQRRKRMNNANIVGFSAREHYRAKKKKMASPGSRLNARDHISLEWESDRNKVVAKKGQVGLSLRHMCQFVEHVPRRRNVLADVCLVPHEIFELENLSEVLSYEVWRSFLSEGERDHLQQFLPDGIDVEQTVQALLVGDNFQFGNPLLDWGMAVCSGEAHPDGILSQEEHRRADKRRYYAELQKYHYEIIDFLQKLKQKWENCKDPEKDIVTKMSGRSRGDTAHANKSRQDLELDSAAPSEPGSWEADEKLSSDSKNAYIARIKEIQKRSKSFMKSVEKERSESPVVALDYCMSAGAKARKKDKLPKHHSTQQSDGAKYMSYLKISKKQHQIVTNMKQSGKSIQSRALNRILGNIDKLDVQPYGLFVEEEQKKLRAHWLQLAKDLPAAHATWEKLRLQKRDIIKSLEGELKDIVNPWMEDEHSLIPLDNLLGKDDIPKHLREDGSMKENQESMTPYQNNDLAPLQDSDIGDSYCNQVPVRNDSLFLESSSYSEQIRDSDQGLQIAPSPPQVLEEKGYSFPYSPSSSCGVKRKEAEVDEYPCSLQAQSLPQASPSSGYHAIELNNVNSIDEKLASEMENSSPVMAEQSSHGEDSQFCTTRDVWKAVGGIGQSCIDRRAYKIPGGGLSIIHNPRGKEEQKNCFVDFEPNVRKEDAKQQSEDGTFSSFPGNAQNELLQSLFKGQGMPSHNPEQLHSLLKGPHSQEHKQTLGVDYQEPSNSLMNGDQFSGHFPDQVEPHAMAQDQQRQNHIYGQGNISENIYCDGRGFLIQRQDWNTSSPQLNVGGAFSQNWQLRSMWANTNGIGCTSDVIQSGANRDRKLVRGTSEAEQILHRGNNTSDQSLFSVLSQCSQLQQPRKIFETPSSTDQFGASSNYGMIMGGTSQASSNLPQPANPLGYLNGSNPVTSLMPDDAASWINQSHQSSALHDPLGKLYPRSWNQ